MSVSEAVAETLGGPEVLGSEIRTLRELAEIVGKGLPYRSFEVLQERLGVSTADLIGLVDITNRTLVRRRHQQVLHKDESDRLYRVARVMARATEVLEEPSLSAAWLRRPNRALGGRTPLSLLDTTAGAEEVLDLLGRIEWGVVS